MKKIMYSLKNESGCYFSTCSVPEKYTIRKARNIFAQSYSGRFLIEGNDGSYMWVNL